MEKKKQKEKKEKKEADMCTLRAYRGRKHESEGDQRIRPPEYISVVGMSGPILLPTS